MKKNNNLYGIILAGGIGSRFWPLSRLTSPKQLLKVAGDESLLKITLIRLAPLIPIKRISVVTNPLQAELIRLHLTQHGLPKGKTSALPEFIIEPVGKNTAPAIGLAAVRLLKKDPSAIMAVLPADHLIKNGEAFLKTIESAARIAKQGYLVTLGVKPKSPETGYGYIKAGNPPLSPPLFQRGGRGGIAMQVERFIEKPDIRRAKEFLKQGGYYWNSGIFIWKAKIILEEIRAHLPNLYKNLISIRDSADIETAYAKMPSISIDKGVLEKSRHVMVIEARFPWSDMGSWNSLKHVFKTNGHGNIKKGRIVDIGSKRSFIIGSDRLVATIGLNDMILIDTPDATLVCPKERAEEVKDIVAIIKKKGYSEHETHITVERPWGAYTVLERGDNYKIKKIRVEPQKRLSLQTHTKRSEHWVVINGQARVRRGEEVVIVKTNESTYIPRGVKHRLENPSKTKPLEIIEVQNGSYVGEDDIIRFDDDYKRLTPAPRFPLQCFAATGSPAPIKGEGK